MLQKVVPEGTSAMSTSNKAKRVLREEALLNLTFIKNYKHTVNENGFRVAEECPVGPTGRLSCSIGTVYALGLTACRRLNNLSYKQPQTR